MPFVEVIYASHEELEVTAVERLGSRVVEIFGEVCDTRPSALRMTVQRIPLQSTLEPYREARS